MNEKALIYINGASYEAVKGQSLIDVLTSLGIPLSAPCGGRKSCGKCKIMVSGEVSPVSKEEDSLLTEKEKRDGIRLACFTELRGSAKITTNVVSDAGYLIFAASEDLPCDGESGIGFAADIGTTTVAVAFYDLRTGKKLLVYTGLNAQRGFGADVISRIGFASESEKNLMLLRSAIRKQINGFVLEFLSDTGRSAEDIVKGVIAGNTVMELIYAGYAVSSLGALPFIPDSYLGIEKSGLDSELACGNARVYIMPCCGGFFGGDAVASMLACGFYGSEKRLFMADIGTNGELAVTPDGRRFFGTSAAAGPAFEGAEIRFGTGSIPGAVCKVESLNGTPIIETVGKKPPCGICGSGLMDAAAAALREGMMDETGCLSDDCPEFEDAPALRIGGGIYVTQKDIRKLQLAKAAILAGAKYLISKQGCMPEASFLTGGFGSALKPHSASQIGLLPSDICKQATAVGNGALQGAAMVLLKAENREHAEYIRKNTELTELSSQPGFTDVFTDGMMFGDIKEI